jgi:lipopolysaccharide transport system permease protein
MMIWYHFLPDWRLLVLPLFMILACGASFGIGLLLCALNVKYRDFRYIVPFIVQFGFFLSPVGYSTTRIPLIWVWHGFNIPARFLYSLNPMVGVIDGFRWCLLRGQSPLDWTSILTAICLTILFCAGGIWYFRKMERTFADVI